MKKLSFFIFLHIYILPLIICAQDIDIKTNPAPDPSEHITLLSMPEVNISVYGPVKQISCFAEKNDTICIYIGDLYKGKNHLEDILKEETSTYQFSTEGYLQKVKIYYLIERSYLTCNGMSYWKTKKGKIQVEKELGVKTFLFQNGHPISYFDSLPGSITSEMIVYDSVFNPICYHTINDDNTQFSLYLSYDSLNRLVYCSDYDKNQNSKGLPHNVYVYQYDSKQLSCRIHDMPVGIPRGDMRLFHYQTLKDGSSLLNISHCADIIGSDSSTYVQLHKDPIHNLPGLFQDRMTKCSEEEYASHHFDNPCNSEAMLTTGYYLFDTLGRLSSYHVKEGNNIDSQVFIEYDSLNKVIEMSAEKGRLSNSSMGTWNNHFSRIVLKYDEHGNRTEIDIYRKENNIEELYRSDRYTYTYDKYGNWITKLFYQDGKLISSEKRNIEYY